METRPGSTGDLLLRAICERPACDTVRLAYADWLEENGSADRAAFIRLQCREGGEAHVFVCACGCNQSTFGTRGAPDWLRTEPVAHLWRECGRDWDRCRPCVVYRRGFASHVICPAGTWVRVGPFVVAREPVDRVTLTDRWPIRSSVASHDDRYEYYRRRGRADRCEYWIEDEIFDWLGGELYRLGNEGQVRVVREAGKTSEALSLACVAYARAAAGLPLQ